MKRAIVLGLFLGLQALPSRASDQDIAMQMYEHMTGIRPMSTDKDLQQMIPLIAKGDRAGAARLLTALPSFYQTTVRNMVTPWSNKDRSISEPFNDFHALIIGAVRDNLDARTILTGNYRYQAFKDLGLPEPSLANNDHYTEIENRGLTYMRYLERVEPQSSGIPQAAGVLTTRGWGKAFYNMGTNRLAVKFSMEDFLCLPQTRWRDPGMPDSFVHRDVPRAPSGDPEIYKVQCKGCHATMDPFVSAFARVDFTANTMMYYTDHLAAKMNQQPDVYPGGHPVYDDSWVNLANQHHNASIGWRGPDHGKGIHAYAELLANSKAFSSCMVQSVFNTVCRRTPTSAAEKDFVAATSDTFETNGYHFRELFETVGASAVCLEM